MQDLLDELWRRNTHYYLFADGAAPNHGAVVLSDLEGLSLDPGVVVVFEEVEEWELVSDVSCHGLDLAGQ